MWEPDECEWLEQVSSYADGETTPEQNTVIEEHMDGCLECQQWLKDVIELTKILRSLPSISVPPSLKDSVIKAIQEAKPSKGSKCQGQ